MTQPLSELIAERVDVALAHRFRLELADAATGQPQSAAQRHTNLTVLFGEIAKGMGVERFAETPVERLDQFAVMSVVKNHDTAGLLTSLMNSFMIAYANPETSERAFEALVTLEALRAEVADARGQTTNNGRLREAATRLEAQLRADIPAHTDLTPRFWILIGADRLFVLAPTKLKLPNEIDGVPIEYRMDDLTARAQ